MSEPSEEIANPPPVPNYSFYLKTKPFDTLKLAIEHLLDPNFNNDGFGMVGAASDSLAISVNDNDNATATLLLKSSGTIEFQSTAPPSRMGAMLAPLRLISQGFPRYLDDRDDDFVVIYHLKGTDRLQLEFGTYPRTGIWATIVENPRVTMFPNLTVLSAITVPVDDIRAMNDYILRAQDRTVFVDWKDDFATFQIGSREKWKYEVKEATRLKQGQSIKAWLSWSYYTRLMRGASFLADKVRVYFLSVPEQHVLFQFRIGESADLFLLQKACLVITDGDMSAEAGARDEDVSDSVTYNTLSIF
ncbi:uncharacterized protein LOC141646537 [Silene latifolia]|uniref:uncharacterized protein LOC141646537 n=1 Tax=Silene latifolia TaxID=37657 RepID=UPI003D776D48